MTPEQLIAWRARLGLTAKAAAEALGLSQNGYAAYERGYVTRNLYQGTEELPRPIPKHVELACERLEQMTSGPVGGEAGAVDKSGKVG